MGGGGTTYGAGGPQGGPIEARAARIAKPEVFETSDGGQSADIMKPDEVREAAKTHFDQFEEEVRPKKRWRKASVSKDTQEGVWELTWTRLTYGKERLVYQRGIDHGTELYFIEQDTDGSSRISMADYIGFSPGIIKHSTNTHGLRKRIDEVAGIFYNDPVSEE